MISNTKRATCNLRLHIEKGDPLIQFHIPTEMLEALAIKAIESSYSIESEILTRLAHSLIKSIKRKRKKK